MMPKTALKFDLQVPEDGRVELSVPFPPGARLTIFVIEAEDVLAELLSAAESSLDFWNNPLDDEDWNHA